MSRFRRGVQTTIRNNHAAYGYSVMITASFGAVSIQESQASVGYVFLFVAGAMIAFALIETLVSGLFRKRLEDEPSEVLALGATFSLFSVSASVGFASLTALLIGGWVVWPLAAFMASGAYVLLAGAEMTLAERLQERRGRA
jgi:hypothetical protein